jgi:hypothetical protein
LILNCGKNNPTPPEIINNVPPACSITYPNNGDTLIIGDITISVDATDSDGHIERVKFYVRDKLLFTVIDSPYSFTYTEPWLQMGNFEIIAVAVDNDSAEGESAISAYFSLFMPVNYSPDTIFVPYDYSSIQDAIDNSQDGDFVIIEDDSYYGNIYINHPVNLIGRGENTIIYEDGIHVESDNVIIRNLKIDPSCCEGSGLFIINSAGVLIDSVFVRGEEGGMECDPYTGFCWPTPGGPAIYIRNSTMLNIQNSCLIGGAESSYIPGGDRGPGLRIEYNSIVFAVDSQINGEFGVLAYYHSLIGIRNCIVVADDGVQYYNDGTSGIIFP